MHCSGCLLAVRAPQILCASLAASSETQAWPLHTLHHNHAAAANAPKSLCTSRAASSELRGLSLRPAPLLMLPSAASVVMSSSKRCARVTAVYSRCGERREPACMRLCEFEGVVIGSRRCARATAV